MSSNLTITSSRSKKLVNDIFLTETNEKLQNIQCNLISKRPPREEKKEIKILKVKKLPKIYIPNKIALLNKNLNRYKGTESSKNILLNYITDFKKQFSKSLTKNLFKKNQKTESEEIDFVNDFFESRKRSIEEEMNLIYKSPSHAKNFLKDFEKKPLAKEVLEIKKKNLVEIKKEFNSYDPKIKNLNLKIKKLDKNLEKYNIIEKENIQQSLILKQTNSDLFLLKREIEFLNHQINTYKKKNHYMKNDVVILKKQEMVLKESLETQKNLIDMKNKEINNENKFLDNLKEILAKIRETEKQVKKTCWTGEHIEKDYTKFEENLKMIQIFEKENLINKNIIKEIKEEKKHENENEFLKYKKKLRNKEEEITNLNEELEKYQNNIDILKKHLNINNENEIVKKFFEMKNSKEMLGENNLLLIKKLDELKTKEKTMDKNITNLLNKNEEIISHKIAENNRDIIDKNSMEIEINNQTEYIKETNSFYSDFEKSIIEEGKSDLETKIENPSLKDNSREHLSINLKNKIKKKKEKTKRKEKISSKNINRDMNLGRLEKNNSKNKYCSNLEENEKDYNLKTIFKNNIEFLQIKRKELKRQLKKENYDKESKKKIILETALCLSRILYQIDRNSSRGSEVNINNVNEKLVFVGLNLEKIVNSIFMKNRFENSINFYNFKNDQFFDDLNDNSLRINYF